MRSGAGMDSETSGAWAPGTPFSVYRPFRRPAAGAARALRHVGLLLVVAGAAAGCAATATEPAFIPVPPRAGPRPAARPAARDIRDYPTALAAIADVLDEDFGLPRPAGTLVVFPSRDAFAAGLLTIGYDPELARRSADAFRAIGGATGVLLNESSLRGARWADRVQLLAHELVHGVQYAFANGVRGHPSNGCVRGLPRSSRCASPRRSASATTSTCAKAWSLRWPTCGAGRCR